MTIKTANPDNRFSTNGTAFDFSFGAYGDTSVRVWETELESALEIAMEWLDDNAPGLLHIIDWADAAHEAGAPDNWREDEEWCEKVAEIAETDVTLCTHTQLKHGDGILSHEWYANEVNIPFPFFSEIENKEHAKLLAIAFESVHNDPEEFWSAARALTHLTNEDFSGYVGGCHLSEDDFNTYFRELCREAGDYLENL